MSDLGKTMPAEGAAMETGQRAGMPANGQQGGDGKEPREGPPSAELQSSAKKAKVTGGEQRTGKEKEDGEGKGAERVGEETVRADGDQDAAETGEGQQEPTPDNPDWES